MVSYHDSRQTDNAYTGVFTVRSLVKYFKNKWNLFFGRQLEKGQKNCCENFLNVFFFFLINDLGPMFSVLCSRSLSSHTPKILETEF